MSTGYLLPDARVPAWLNEDIARRGAKLLPFVGVKAVDRPTPVRTLNRQNRLRAFQKAGLARCSKCLRTGHNRRGCTFATTEGSNGR